MNTTEPQHTPKTPEYTYTWSPPLYDISTPPAPFAQYRLTRDEGFVENFGRVAKWSPDGSTLLLQCENRTFQFIHPPPEVLDLSQELPVSATSTSNHADSQSNGTTIPTQTHHSPTTQTHLTLHQPSPILDFTWYPSAARHDPASFCFLASVRECPVKLIDAEDGRLRASYRIVDHRERQIAPHSLAFNLSADKIYCGFEDAIEVFDVNRPGEGTRLPTTPSKKSKDGLKGIISALTFCPSQGSDIYAAGSLAPTPSSNIALFSESQGEIPIMFLGGGARSGVSQLHFNPAKPHILYAAFRRNPGIYSWDLRTNVNSPLQIFSKAPSGADSPQDRDMTNQRMRFDVDISGRWLGVGDQRGDISIFDLNSIDGTEVETEALESGNSVDTLPSLTFHAHEDSIGSVSFHPLRPLLTSISGSRHFDVSAGAGRDSDSPDTSDSDSEEEYATDEKSGERLTETTPDIVVRSKRRQQPMPLDSSIRMWNFSTTTNNVNDASI